MGRNRLAVLVGCNYTNTRFELKGCINDVHSMRDLLIKRFGFKSENIKVLTDARGSSLMPTGANIKMALEKMIDDSEKGDVLFFHFSGHGTKIISVAHEYEGVAIVPCDFNLITDVDFRLLVNRIPVETSFTILADSCHSGGLIDQEKEQIGPALDNPIGLTSPAGGRCKGIPYEVVQQQLISMSNINTSDIGTLLTALFGQLVSAMFKLPQPAPQSHPDSGILLSACRPDERAYDVSAKDRDPAHGAFSNAVKIALEDNKGSDIDNWEIVWASGILLLEQKIKQHPCLYCSDGNANAPFLKPNW